MSFSDAIKSAFSKYATFSGRARRSEYWWFVLFYAIVYVVAAGLDALLFGNRSVFEALVWLALILPGLAVTIRRLHDTDRTGWWVFLSLIPLVGAIILIIWYCGEGTSGPNKFGEDPAAAFVSV
jgi:uncharacterized membrane protein YhaH (DUF805 family)